MSGDSGGTESDRTGDAHEHATEIPKEVRVREHLARCSEARGAMEREAAAVGLDEPQSENAKDDAAAGMPPPCVDGNEWMVFHLTHVGLQPQAVEPGFRLAGAFATRAQARRHAARLDAACRYTRAIVMPRYTWQPIPKLIERFGDKAYLDDKVERVLAWREARETAHRVEFEESRNRAALTKARFAQGAETGAPPQPRSPPPPDDAPSPRDGEAEGKEAAAPHNAGHGKRARERRLRRQRAARRKAIVDAARREHERMIAAKRRPHSRAAKDASASLSQSKAVTDRIGEHDSPATECTRDNAEQQGHDGGGGGERHCDEDDDDDVGFIKPVEFPPGLAVPRQQWAAVVFVDDGTEAFDQDKEPLVCWLGAFDSAERCRGWIATEGKRHVTQFDLYAVAMYEWLFPCAFARRLARNPEIIDTDYPDERKQRLMRPDTAYQDDVARYNAQRAREGKSPMSASPCAPDPDTDDDEDSGSDREKRASDDGEPRADERKRGGGDNPDVLKNAFPRGCGSAPTVDGRAETAVDTDGQMPARPIAVTTVFQQRKESDRDVGPDAASWGDAVRGTGENDGTTPAGMATTIIDDPKKEETAAEQMIALARRGKRSGRR